MKTNYLKFYLNILIGTIFLVSCSDDEDGPKGAFESGVIIVNEGNFQSANASISHFDPNSGTVTNNIFSSNNNDAVLGDVAQSAFVSNDIAYIVINNSNKLELAQANTFEAIATIDALLPRQFLALGNVGFLTEWVSFTDPGRVSVIDLNSNSVSSTITTQGGAENMIISNNSLYVSNNFAGTVSVIDIPSAQVTSTLDVGNAPGGFVMDSNGNIWLICGGGFDPVDFSPLNDGALYKINPNDNSFTSIDLMSNVPTKIATNVAQNAIYYYTGTDVYKLDITSNAAPTTPFISESTATGFYGIGVDPSSDILYMGDAKGFQANGAVYRYNSNGTLIDSFNVGIGPNGFVFR